MKILLVIDCLGSGGAQRQLSILGRGLVEKGYSVDIFNYFPEIDFFRDALKVSGISFFDYKKKPGFDFGVIRALRLLLKKKQYDFALAFLDSPGIYLTIAGLGLKTKIVVSDRTSWVATNKTKLLFRKQLFRLADSIVVNSETQTKWLIDFCRLPEKKVVTIRNGYDRNLYPFSPLYFVPNRELKIIAIGRISPAKNIEVLIAGLDFFYEKNGWIPSLSWVGITDDADYEAKIMSKLNETPNVKRVWSWLGERKDIAELLAQHHALILPSKWEGFPNVVCEALFVGKPVICSNVCDNPLLVEEGVNGFLFDPNLPADLALGLERLSLLSYENQEKIAFTNRKCAEENLACERMVELYERLFRCG